MQYHYAIELGGSFTTIFAKNIGFVLKEPTMIAVEKHGQEYQPCAFGKEAKALLWKTKDSVEVFNPITSGVIENYEYTKAMMEHFLAKIDFKRGHKCGIVLIPCGLTNEEKTEYYHLFEDLGFASVDLVPNVMASAVGVGCNLTSSKASMVVNIGGTTTDVAVMNLCSIIKGASLGIGGKQIDNAIANSLALSNNNEEKRILIGLPTAEKLKNEIGSLYKNDTLKMEVMGLDYGAKTPKARVVTSQEIRPVLQAFFEEIVRTIDVTINSLQPEISADILKNGIIFVGGLCKIAGFELFLKNNLPYPFEIAQNPEDVTIFGAGKMLNDTSLCNKIVRGA